MSEQRAGEFQGFAPSSLTKCPRCHVDLTGQCAAGRCPQCGMAYDADTRVWSRSPLGSRTGKLLCVMLPALSVLFAWLLFYKLDGPEHFDISLILVFTLAGTAIGSLALIGIALGARQIVTVTGDSLVAIDMSGSPIIVPFAQIESVRTGRSRFRYELIVEHPPVNIPHRRPTRLPMRGYPPALLEEIARYANRRCSDYRASVFQQPTDDASSSDRATSEPTFTGFAPANVVLCPQCDYKLLGLPPVGACPECGCRYDAESMVVEQTLARSNWFSNYMLLPMILFIQLPTLVRGLFGNDPFMWYCSLLILFVLLISIILRMSTQRSPRILIAVLPDGVLTRRILRTPTWLRYDDITRVYFGSDTASDPRESNSHVGMIQLVHKPTSKNSMNPPKRTKISLAGCAAHDLYQLMVEGNRRIANEQGNPSNSRDA